MDDFGTDPLRYSLQITYDTQTDMILPLLLGDEQFKALKEHLRNKNGVVKASEMVNEITEIMQGANETKKS